VGEKPNIQDTQGVDGDSLSGKGLPANKILNHGEDNDYFVDTLFPLYPGNELHQSNKRIPAENKPQALLQLIAVKTFSDVVVKLPAGGISYRL
jgi:hypothetical protein